MTSAEVFKNIIVPLSAVGALPCLGWFALQIIKMGKDMVRLDSDIQHLRGNYAQSMAGINLELTEMRSDIKELLRRLYKSEANSE